MSASLRGWICALLVCAGACQPQDACDPGYYADHGACYLIDAGSGSDEDSGDDDPYAGFGDPCTSNDDCNDNAPVCGRPPFQVCTQTGCMEEPTLCPPTWTCFDVTGLSGDPNITSACVNL